MDAVAGNEASNGKGKGRAEAGDEEAGEEAGQALEVDEKEEADAGANGVEPEREFSPDWPDEEDEEGDGAGKAGEDDEAEEPPRKKRRESGPFPLPSFESWTMLIIALAPDTHSRDRLSMTLSTCSVFPSATG